MAVTSLDAARRLTPLTVAGRSIRRLVRAELEPLEAAEAVGQLLDRARPNVTVGGRGIR